jgi:NAD(P)-dependent dehydrogenase (short-subunit alcohol dehydrogenase family)
MKELFNLNGKIAIVTGASGGLGRHFSEVLAKAGAIVCVAARRIEKINETVDSIESLGGSAFGFEMDVTNLVGVESTFELIEKKIGPVTIVINNAGVASSKLAMNMEADDWDIVMDTNLKGAWTVALAAAQRMARAETGGTIVNIASILGIGISKGVMPYAVSKAGLIQMTKALALEWSRHGIRVNALAPGYVETDLSREYLVSKAGQALLKRVPQRRPAEMRELDAPLLLLASDASSYMTGSVINVDGGHLISSL